MIAQEDLTTDIKENAYLSVFNEWENQTKSVPTLDKDCKKNLLCIHAIFYYGNSQILMSY